jgi:Ca2+-binding EF-hand superfamily protein
MCVCFWFQKTAANSEKERMWATEKAAKDKKKRKKAAAKAAVKGGYAERMADDFLDDSKKDGMVAVIRGLLLDPMIPYLAITSGLMFAFDAIYSWQFFTLLEIALRENSLQCTVHGDFGAAHPRVCTPEFYSHPDPETAYPVQTQETKTYRGSFGYYGHNESCAQIALWPETGAPNVMNSANLNEPEDDDWNDQNPDTWTGVRPYAFSGLDSTEICEWCEIRAAPDWDTKNSLLYNQASNGGPLCNGGSDQYPECLYYASKDPNGEESDLNDPGDPLREATYKLSADYTTNMARVTSQPPGLSRYRDWRYLPSMEIIMEGYSNAFTVGVFIGPGDNLTVTEAECDVLKGLKSPSPYCCHEPECDSVRRYPSGTCSTSQAYWPTVRFDKGDNGKRIDVKPRPSMIDFDSDWGAPYFVPKGQFQNRDGDEPKEMTTKHCASGNLRGFHRPESDLVFFERINAELAVYQGVMRMIAALFQPINLALNSYIMGSRGIFGVTMLLPAYCILYNIANSLFSGLWTVIFTRALYMSMFANNFASARVLWYAVPESVKIVAYPIVVDILPAGAKGLGALLTLFMQATGLTAGNEVLTLLMVAGSGLWIFMIHTGLRAGYAKHLADSLSTRAASSGDINFDVRDSKVVEYITDFLMLGHTGQKLFILNLLKGQPLEPFYDSLIHMYALKPDVETVVKLIEVTRLDEEVVSNQDLLNTINDEFEEAAIVGAALLAIGIRRMRDATDRIEELLDSEHKVVQLNAAIALLHLNPEQDDREKVRVIITRELSLQNDTEARAICLKQLAAALFQKVKMETGLSPVNANVQVDFSRLPRPKSRQIKRLGLEYILPMVAQSLTVLGTADAASEVLNMFDSKEVQHMFGKLFTAEEGKEEDVRVFYKQSVFDYLAANSKRTFNNGIVDTLLELDMLQRPDMLGSKMATMVFRAVIAVAQNAPLARAQVKVVREMIERDLERAYRKLSVLFWLSTISFSAMLTSFISHHLHLTKERILLLLAAICPYDPVDEYADVVLLVEDPDQKASAMELIEAAAPADLWLKIQPILAPDGDMTLEDRVRVGKRLYANMTESVDEALEEYLMSSSEIWPAFVLDLCIKNELYDFLDSVPWKDIQETIDALYNEREQGRLTDGSHLLLEIINRDTQKTRKSLKDIKDSLVKAHRKKEMKEDLRRMADAENAKRSKKKRFGKSAAESEDAPAVPTVLTGDDMQSMDAPAEATEDEEVEQGLLLGSADQTPSESVDGAAGKPKALSKLKSKTTSALLGESGQGAMSLDMLASQDGYGEKSTYMDASQDQNADATEDEDIVGFLCFKRQREYTEEEQEDRKAEDARIKAEKQAEILVNKLRIEFQVRFHREFGTTGRVEMMALKPEPERLQLTLEKQIAEEDLVVPVVMEVDYDIMADYVDDGKGYGAGAGGKKKKSWKTMLKRGGESEDGFMVVDEQAEHDKKKKKKKKKKNKKKGKGGEEEEEAEGPTDPREAELIDMFNLGYREIFFKCDVKASRELDDDEMANLPRVLDIKLTDDELEMIRKEMDVHKQGLITWAEWIDWWRGNSPGWQLILEKKQEGDAEKLELAKTRRESAEESARKMAEDVAEYWVADTTIKPSKLNDRRIEVQGKGRGTVTQGSKKGALIAFDGNPAEWVGSFDDVLEEQQPFEEMIRAADLKTISWRVLKESSVNKFAEERLRKFEEEVVVRAAKEESKKKATLAQLNLEWKKAYGTDKKNKSGFGVVAKRAIARATGNEMLQSADLIDTNDVRAEAWERFELLDIDKSGSIDQREMDRIDAWFQELKLVDELGVEIPEAQYAVRFASCFPLSLLADAHAHAHIVHTRHTGRFCGCVVLNRLARRKSLGTAGPSILRSSWNGLRKWRQSRQLRPQMLSKRRS